MNNLLSFLVLTLIYTYFLGTNLNSSIIFLSSGDIYLFLGVAISTSPVLSLLCNSLSGFFEAIVILSAILLPIKSPVASACFLNCSFSCSFYCICYIFFSTIKTFLTIFIT